MIQALRFSPEGVAIEFLRAYDATPSCDLKQIPLEAIALKAQCNFTELLGAMMFSFRNVQAQRSAAIAMEAHPGIVAASAKFATKAKNVQDRKMLHEAVGFLPTPKGASINLNFPGKEKGDDEGEAVTPEFDQLFPRTVRKQEDWQADRSRMLEGGN